MHESDSNNNTATKCHAAEIHAIGSKPRLHSHLNMLCTAFHPRSSDGGQVELPRHTDAGNISFMIALSPYEAYEGGGTFFDLLGKTVSCPQVGYGAWVCMCRGG